MTPPRTAHLPYAKQSWFKNPAPDHIVHEISDVQSEFIDWLLDPTKGKGSQADWARAHGLPTVTPGGWKKYKWFREEWEKRALAINGGIERVQILVDTLFEKAKTGDVKAIQLYMEYVDQYTPKQVRVIEDRSTSDLSDEELASALEANVTQLRSKGA